MGFKIFNMKAKFSLMLVVLNYFFEGKIFKLFKNKNKLRISLFGIGCIFYKIEQNDNGNNVKNDSNGILKKLRKKNKNLRIIDNYFF